MPNPGVVFQLDEPFVMLRATPQLSAQPCSSSGLLFEHSRDSPGDTRLPAGVCTLDPYSRAVPTSATFELSRVTGLITSCNGNPLVDVRTGARHADGRLGGLWSRHGLKKGTRGLWPRWFYSKLNRNKPNKTDRKIYLHGEYISPTRVKFAS
jgi:hypothetical protein